MREKPWLLEPHRTKDVLQAHGFHFQKRFGQNFLLDARVLKKIIDAADISEEDFVLEIGPGIGTLTQYLAYYAGTVCAVEIDQNLLPILEETLADWDNVQVIEGDIMKLDVKKLLEEHAKGRRMKVVANLPYYITTPIIMNLLEARLPIDSITVMVQKEVAQRMEARAGSEEYGALSLAVQYYSIPEMKASVPPNCFIPRPKVASSVITLKRRAQMLPVADERLLFLLIRAAFGQRRKTLVNAIKNHPELYAYLSGLGIDVNRAYLEQVLEQCGFPASVRGEALSLEEFIRLADMLFKKGQ